MALSMVLSDQLQEKVSQHRSDFWILVAMIVLFYLLLFCCEKYRICTIEGELSEWMFVTTFYLFWAGFILYFASFKDLATVAFCLSIGIPLSFVVPCLFTLKRDLRREDGDVAIFPTIAFLALIAIFLGWAFSWSWIAIVYLAFIYLIMSCFSSIALEK